MLYVGVDAHQETSQVTVMDQGGQVKTGEGRGHGVMGVMGRGLWVAEGKVQ